MHARTYQYTRPHAYRHTRPHTAHNHTQASARARSWLAAWVAFGFLRARRARQSAVLGCANAFLPAGLEPRRVQSIYHQIDSSNKGFVTWDQFITFYHESAKTKPHVVWKNIESFGYRQDMKKHADAVDINIQVEHLPRHIVMTDPNYYQTLFALIDANPENGSIVWELLQQIPTDPSIMEKVVNFVNRGDLAERN